MSTCPKVKHMEHGLKTIVDDLMGELWVEKGVCIQSLSIWEEFQGTSKGIEVIPIARADADWLINIRIGDKNLQFKWQALRMVSDSNGLYESAFGDCNASELATAAGLMLMYYGNAMTEEH